VVQAAEIKYAVQRNGGTNADLKALSSGDMFAKILPVLRGYGKVIVTLLEFISTINITATATKFVAKEKFKLKKDGGICSYLGDNFKEWFLSGDGKTEEQIGEQTLRYTKLLRSSLDGPIIIELGGEEKAETTLAEVFSLMEKQPKGEEGALLTNGWANIFYVRDDTGVLRAVRVHWHDVGWHVLARGVSDPSSWHAGSQVFSRNYPSVPQEPAAS
ncbi:hypothetical protein A2121_00275, partial [Candidatus Nomurabacteria bacterium GWB1_40_6]